MTDQHETGSIVAFDDLDHTEHAHEFVGAEHGDVPFSIILVHSEPGVGPKLHRHPYPEVFVVESGQATFRIGDATAVVEPATSSSARRAKRTASSTAARARCA